MIEGQSFTVTGSTDYPVCDCCGKTNLTRAVAVTNEHGEEFNVGCICASQLMRQVYQRLDWRQFFVFLELFPFDFSL